MSRLGCFNSVAITAVLCVFPRSGVAQDDSDDPPNSLLESLVLDDVDLPPSLFETLDQLTMQMGRALREGDTRVVWLVDRSGSLQQRREQIAQAIPAMIRAAARGSSNALETVVVGFGARTNVLLHLQHIRNDTALRQLADVLREIPPDESGRENVFSALIRTAQTFSGAQGNPLGKEVLFFVITDEPGDDAHRLEEAIAKLKADAVRCSMAGHVTPFLSTRHLIDWTYDDGFTEEIAIDAGSETALPRRVFSLPLSPVVPREIPSGFGPWPLVRLCVETEGSYLANHSEYELRYEDADLEPYTPDTSRPLGEFALDIAGSAEERTLVSAVQLAYRASFPDQPRSFTSRDDRILQVRLTDAQKRAAVTEHYVTQVYEQLDAIADDRDNFANPRWRADYDLSLARILAAKVRLLTYNLQIARMKIAPLTLDAGKDTWLLTPAEVGEVGPVLESAIQRAENELQRVIDDHPGTPWAAVAEQELAVPWGWTWEQD